MAEEVYTVDPNKEGSKPPVGASVSPLLGGISGVYRYDENGNAVEVRGAGRTIASQSTQGFETDPEKARIGDYYYDTSGKLQTVPNSPTGLMQRYDVAVGGTAAPRNTVSIANEGSGAVQGAAIGSVLGPVGAAVGAVIGALNAHNTAAEQALKDWQNENVKHDYAVEFYKDDDGTLRYKVDYEKMATGGARSGEAVKAAQNVPTKVWLGDDGRLKINVSPIFATTAKFDELVNWISENYAGLSKDTENVDQILTELQNGIDGEVQNFIGSMKLYADYANRFPNASPDSVVAAYSSETAGYVDPDKMSDYVMSYVDGNEIKTITADKFFDAVLALDKDHRNKVVEDLMAIVNDTEGKYSDSQKAVAYGDMRALYAASANPEQHENSKYQGMMDSDVFVTLINGFAPLGFSVGDALRTVTGGNFYSKQEYLNQNEWASFISTAASVGAGMGLFKGGTKLAEGILKRLPGTSRLFQASLEGQSGGALSWFAQNVGNTKAVFKAAAASAAFKTLKVGLFDAALVGAKSAVSGTDFLSEFGRDFARDAILEAVFSYYDMLTYQQAVNDSVAYVYRDPKTGKLTKLNVSEGQNAPDRVFMAGDGTPTDEFFTSVGYSGKPEEFTRSGNGTSSYEQVGKMNLQQTRYGDTVGIVQTADGTAFYYNGKVVYAGNGANVEGINLLNGADAPLEGLPAFNNGVVQSGGASEAEMIKKALEDSGLPINTEVTKMSKASADSAIAASKIAKVQGTKLGLKTYESLFNKNGVLDVANNMALAKTGDLNAWREAQENFVSIANNSQRNLDDIKNGVYLKGAATEWENTVKVMGQFNYQYHYDPKTDGRYINVLNQLQRAQLLNDTRVEGDKVDYVAKAMEKYKDVIAAMPEDRAVMLSEWLEQGKKWLTKFNKSAAKSGKIDVKALENVMESDLQSEVGYFPVWGKKQTYSGLLDTYYGISKKRDPYKDWLRDGEWVPIEELEDPFMAMNRYMSFVTTNMGLNDMIESTAEVFDAAGLLVDNTPTAATVRKNKLRGVKNVDEIKGKLNEMVEAKKKEVKEKTLTPKQYNEMMTKLYTDSAIEETATALTKGVFEEKSNENKEIMAEIAGLRRDIDRINSEIEERQPKTDAKAVIPELPYKERKKLAQEFVDRNFDYVLLYRMQGGKPDQWRPNNRGQAGKFIGRVGELEGAVWLTSDPDWVEGPERATAGVKSEFTDGVEVTDDNIVVIPVKKSDIFDNTYSGGEEYKNDEVLRKKIEDSGKKLIQTRTAEKLEAVEASRKNGIAPRYMDHTNPKNNERTEFILFEQDHPEVLSDGMDLLLEQYNKDQQYDGLVNQKAIRNLERDREITENAIKDLEKSINKSSWNDIWKALPAKVRKDIRDELTKTAPLTGYGIKDTRARLNSLVPGFDVLDWSLLSRPQTNGLVEGGLYKNAVSNEVKVYIMDLEDLAAITKYELNPLTQNGGERIREDINTKGGNAILPLHLRGSGDGPEFWLKERWGHGGGAGGAKYPDTFHDWSDYLASLKAQGITKVPVAIDDTTDGKYGSLEKNIKDKLNNATKEVVDKNTGRLVEKKLTKGDLIDITDDVKRAFSEYGVIPLYHNQNKPLGSLEFNSDEAVPSGEERYIAGNGIGDALWVAPNASYTDEYGRNKLAANIPTKYFMSSKEMYELSEGLAMELRELRDKAKEKALAKMADNDAKALKKDKKAKELSLTGTFADQLAFEIQHGLKDIGIDEDIIAKYPSYKRFEYDEKTGRLYGMDWHFVETNDKGAIVQEVTYTPLEHIWHSPGEMFSAVDDGVGKLPKKEQARYAELDKIVEPYTEGKASSHVRSYRALAEYAGKPIIDTTEDMLARRGISGTAFFYYDGVSPEFDNDLGRQLSTQANMEASSPRWSGDEIARKMEELDGISLGELIDDATDGRGFSDYFYDLLSDFEEGEVSSSEMTEEFESRLKNIEKTKPGMAKVMKETWENNPISSNLSDMKFHYWHPSTGYVTIDDDVAAMFLEEMGEKPPIPEGATEVAAGQASLYDMVAPSAQNIPNRPDFKQPRNVTSNDYAAGLAADPSMADRIKESYKGILSEKLIKEASRMTNLASDYLEPYAINADVESYLNTSLIPDLQTAINGRMVPDEFVAFIGARMAQAVQDVAPYQSPELVLKSNLESIAEDWHNWAVKHIKSGRATYKELINFAGSHNLDLPEDKRPIASKIKSVLYKKYSDGKRLPKIEGFKLPKTANGEKVSKAEFYKALDATPLFQSAVKNKDELVDWIAEDINAETTDAFTMGAAASAVGYGGRYPITWYRKGKPYTRLMKYSNKQELLLAENTYKLLTDKELIKNPGLISRTAAALANDFRLLTTGMDPSRIWSNLTRDTSRSVTFGTRFIQAKKMLTSVIDLGDYSPEQKEILTKAIENAADAAASSSYNSAYRTPRKAQQEITKEFISKDGKSPMKRFSYNLKHDKRSILEFPMEFFEGYSRRANARSLAAVQLGKDQAAGVSFEEQVKNAVNAANFAGREYTANFQRKGKLIGSVSKYVAYLSSNYAGLDGIARAYIDNPTTTTRNFAIFVIAYLLLLADTLSRDETRKQYYRLSENDRENQIVIGMGDSVLTIPMDQELAAFLFPYRRIMETLNNVDPVSFFEFIWGTITEPMPFDLSGFSEGGGFNITRGLEKLAAQHMPTALTGIQEAATGYDLYYGSDISVSDEDLKNQGIYAPKPGDYTTTGKDSLLLRTISNLTGIKQWQLQAMVSNYTSNVGQYVLNTIDKMAGATKEQQGGKDFANAVFSSMTALDQDGAKNVFYDGISKLKVERNKLIQTIQNANEDMATATGSDKASIQMRIQKAKDEFGTKVADFVSQYVNAYEITGGLPRNLAMQVYYLFRLEDDNTVYPKGSVAEYYNDKAKQEFKEEATAMSAPILDKYYNNRIGNVYQDSEGVWRRYLSSGAQAMRNSIYGESEERMVDLLNILEGKNSTLKNERTKAKNARNEAYNKKDYTERDRIGYEFDKKVVEALTPYINKYGAENVLGSNEVLDYLSDWFFVPSDFKVTKNGKYVSLGNGGSTEEAFVRPYIKYVFGLPTDYYDYSETTLTSPEVGKIWE